MKKIAFFGAVAVLLGSGFVSTASAQVRIGTVDMKRVFDSYYKTKDAEQQVNEQRNKVRKELEDRLDGYKKAGAELQKIDEEIKRPELSASAKEAKQREGNEKFTKFKQREREDNEYRHGKEKELQDLSLKLHAAIVEDITKVVSDRAKTEPFDLVFDRTGPSLNNLPVILYSKESYDFTTDVVNALNRARGSTEAVRPAVKAPEIVRPVEVARPPVAATPKKVK